MPLILTHSASVQPLIRADLQISKVFSGEIVSEVDCPTFLTEVTEDLIESTLEDEDEIIGTVEQDEIVATVEEDEV